MGDAPMAIEASAPEAEALLDDPPGHPGNARAAEILAGKKSKDPMTELLHWAIEHGDPEKQKEVLAMYKENNLTLKDVYGQDLIDALFVNEGNVMKDLSVTIADFRNETKTDEELEEALTALQDFVEQVDNAGNLHRMGGLSPLLEIGVTADGAKRGAEIQALALWTMGVAVQNNPPVQDDLLRIGALEQMVSRLLLGCGESDGSHSPQYCNKLLFALSGLVRNNATIQAAADKQGLFD